MGHCCFCSEPVHVCTLAKDGFFLDAHVMLAHHEPSDCSACLGQLARRVCIGSACHAWIADLPTSGQKVSSMHIYPCVTMQYWYGILRIPTMTLNDWGRMRDSSASSGILPISVCSQQPNVVLVLLHFDLIGSHCITTNMGTSD